MKEIELIYYIGLLVLGVIAVYHLLFGDYEQGIFISKIIDILE